MKQIISNLILKLSTNKTINKISSKIFRKYPIIKIKLLAFIDKTNAENHFRYKDSKIIKNNDLLTHIKNEVESYKSTGTNK